MSSIFGDSSSTSAAIDGSVQALGSGPAVSWAGNIETFPLNPSGLYATFSPELPTSGVLRVRISHPTHYFDVTSLALTSANMTIAWTAASWESNSVVYDEEFKPHFQIWSDETYLTSFDYTGSLYTESISFEGTLIQAAARNTPVLHMPLAGDLIDTVRGQAMVPSGTTSFSGKSIVMDSASGAFTITNPGHDWRDFTLCAFMRGPSGAGVMDLRVGQADTSVIVSLSPTANVEITTLKDGSSLITNVDEDTRQTWFHVAVQQNATHVDVYIDQVLAHSRDLEPALDPDPDRVSLRYPVVFNADLASELAHVTIYPYALDTADRLAHAESWSGYVPPPALVLHLPLSADHIALVGTTPAVLPPGSGSFTDGYLTMDTAYSFETSSDTFSATNGFTMCAWMRSAAGWQPGDYVRFRVFEGNFTTNSKAELDLESGHVWSRHEQVTGLSAGQWYHLTWRWRPSDNLQELLVDGVVSASSIQPGQFTTYQSWRVKNNAVGAAMMHLQVWDGYVEDIAQLMIDYPLPAMGMHWPLASDLVEANGGVENLAVESGTTSYADGGLYIDATAKLPLI